jgi:Holliday junction resolvase RusA-like endonuclease
MNYISIFIKGIPYGKSKTRGDIEAPSRWSEAVKMQTEKLPKVKEACILKVTFLLPADKFPTDFRYGPDLDNLLKRFLDALNETIFSEAPGKDSCIISMNVTKVKVSNTEDAGVQLEVLPVSVTT